MARSVYNLIWNVDVEERRYAIKSYPLFIGRLPLKFEKVVKDYNPLNVYIYYPNDNKAHFTGIVSATVSRFHVKLEEKNGQVFLIDHGNTGKGSRNGTYLNGEKIRPGQRVLLRPGDSFQLGRLGPVFMLVMRRVEGETIVLKEGIPTLMPIALARKLEKVGGIQVETYDRSLALVTLEPVVDRKIVVEGLVVHTEKQSEKERISKILLLIEYILSDALEYLKEYQDLEKAKSILLKLQLKPYRNLIESLGEKELCKAYYELLKLVKMDIIDIEALTNRIQSLRHMIKGFMEIESVLP